MITDMLINKKLNPIVTDFQNFMNLYEKCTAKPYSF